MLSRRILLKSLILLIGLTSAARREMAAATGDLGTVNGVVFFDKNGNGIRDRDEPGFSGVLVYLFGRKNDDKPFYLTARTDSAGKYAFSGELIGRGSMFLLTTGGAPRAAVIPTVYHPLRTFYTATNGDDKNPGSLERPFRTIGRAATMLQAGDLLYIRNGEYREYLSTDRQPLHGGSGWDRPIVVAGMPGETVTIRPEDREGPDSPLQLTFPQQQYLVFDNLTLDAEGVTLAVKSKPRDENQPSPCHVRLINCEVRNSIGSGVFAAGDDHQFINCRIHHNGRSQSEHGIHLSGQHNLIQGCDTYFNSGSGIMLYNGKFDSSKDEARYGASENVIRGNRVHDNDLVREGSAGIGLETGRKNLVYDNVLWGNGVGVIVNLQSFEQKIFNNTIVDNRRQGIAIGSDMETQLTGKITTETHDNVVRNNIAIGNTRQPILIYSKTSVADHNTFDGDPQFRDPLGGDYHLLAGSRAIDSGETIPEVRSDFDGIPRPQGKAYDRGAYEYSANALVPTTKTFTAPFFAGQLFPVNFGFAKPASGDRKP